MKTNTRIISGLSFVEVIHLVTTAGVRFLAHFRKALIV
jgi:hypothetical protein